MRKVLAIFLSLFLVLTDAVLSTVFYCNGSHFTDVFSHALSGYSFSKSVLELWILSVVRVAVIIGLLIGIIINTAAGVARVKACIRVAVTVDIAACMFALIKLLAVSDRVNVRHNVWFWCLFSWTIFCSVLVLVQWRLLSNITQPLPMLHVNCEDTDQLLDPGDKKDANTGNKKSKENKGTTKNNKGTLLRLLGLTKPDWYLFVIGFIFLTLSATGEIFIPYYTGVVVDGIVIDKSEAEFERAIVIMALISLVSAFSAGIRGGCLFTANRRMGIRIRNDLFAAIMKQEIGFFDSVQTGDITSRLTSDTTTMSETIGLSVNVFLRNLIKAVGVIIFMFKLSWRLTVVTFIALPVMLAISEVYGKYYKKVAEDVQTSLADVNNIAEEACSTIRTVRSFANEGGEISRYRSKLDVTYKLYLKQAKMYTGFVWSSNLFELALKVAVLYYGGRLVIGGILTGGTLISFILYQIQLGDCISSMGNVYSSLMEAAGASVKVFEYIDRTPQVSPVGTRAPPTLKGHVEFRNVTFTYPTRPGVQVLKNISFSVKPGEVVALVGPSGGGKTTCVNLLENFYETETGQVLLDHIPIQEYDHHYLHKQVSLVGQEPVLYAQTIEENVRYGLNEDEWTPQGVREATGLANAHDFISDMKDDYRTQAGEKGVQLSGGQKQRIAIARSLLRKPTVLLLDEATSALDSESEFLVQQALYQNMTGRTVIIIAHRLSTVERADRIIVIDKGSVMEQGTHQQLLERRGMYSKLVNRQLLMADSSWTAVRSPLSDANKECVCRKRHRRISGGRHWSGNSTLSQDSYGLSPRVVFTIGSI